MSRLNESLKFGKTVFESTEAKATEAGDKIVFGEIFFTAGNFSFKISASISFDHKEVLSKFSTEFFKVSSLTSDSSTEAAHETKSATIKIPAEKILIIFFNAYYYNGDFCKRKDIFSTN